MAPSEDPGARSGQSPAALRETYWSCHRAHGAWSWTRAPRRARPYRRRRLFVMPGFIDEKPGMSDPRSAAAVVPHDPRGRDVSRSCSEGRTVFFARSASRALPPRARSSPDWPACRARPSARPKVQILVAPRSARPGSCRSRLQHPAPQSGRWTRGADRARLPPTLLQQPHPRPAHAVPQSRNVRGLHPGITVEQAPFSEIHRIGLHRRLLHLVHAEVPRRAQAVQGLSEKRFNGGVARSPGLRPVSRQPKVA